jgi:anaerobic ribonucleoside-triphosphate reductase activating protein
MNYAKIKPVDVANGEGVRVSLFVSGCTHHCKGCFNSELWDHDAGEPFTSDMIFHIIQLCKREYISGLSLLGGEPLDARNLMRVTDLCYIFKKWFPFKTIWCYTGYKWEQVKHMPIMKHIDVLVDGQFVQELADPRLKFRGSSNQRIIDVKKSFESGQIYLRKDLME